jgi:NitT/TauT family transport system substrate-binding protein
MVKALHNALVSLQTMPPQDLIKALPHEMTVGADTKALEDVLARYRSSLYPTTVAIDTGAAQRVADTLAAAGLIKPDVKVSGLLDTAIAGAG